MRGCPKGEDVWTRNKLPCSLGLSVCLCYVCIASYCCSLAMHASTGRNILDMRQIYHASRQSWTPPHLLRGSSQLFVCDTLETAIHICVLGDNLQFKIIIQLSTQSSKVLHYLMMTDSIPPNRAQTLTTLYLLH